MSNLKQEYKEYKMSTTQEQQFREEKVNHLKENIDELKVHNKELSE